MKPTPVLLAAAICLLAGSAMAEDAKIGALEIIHPWARATPKGASIGAAYATIKNTGSVPDRLVGGTMVGATSVEVHEMTMEDGVARMRPVKGGLEIKPGETVELKPGSLHVMFVGLKKPLAAGDHVNGTLVFEKAGTLNVEYEVLAMGATPMPGMQMHGH